ncbi:MAG: SET domain-containing protein [Chloroflexi bacterium]|nr:SET domain-containing protein [Chloroflexota bacterium]
MLACRICAVYIDHDLNRAKRDPAVDQLPHDSYFASSLIGCDVPEKGGRAVFAAKPIQAGDLLVMWGGAIHSQVEFDALSPKQRSLSLQVEEGLYLVPQGLDNPADWVNHSCTPNAGLSGQIGLVAMRDIAAGEEITFDYAMSDGDPYDEFECACGTPNCRQRVTGNDWQRPDLWERYAGYFSPYLQRRIDRLRHQLQVEAQRPLRVSLPQPKTRMSW